jgi:succinyl-CoA synthetase alpha subunit
MSIFLNANNKVIVQGITGAEATTHTARMLKAGTQIVGGVNARKAGTEVHVDKEAKTSNCRCSAPSTIEKTGTDVSIIFVPPSSPTPSSGHRRREPLWW